MLTNHTSLHSRRHSHPSNDRRTSRSEHHPAVATLLPVVVVDYRDAIRSVNPPACDLLATPANELVGKHIGPLRHDIIPGEHSLLRSNGESITVEVTKQNVRIKGESVVALTVVDVTARKQRESDRIVREITLRQEDKWKSLENLASGVAHQFNNLNMIIIGTCSRLKGSVVGDQNALGQLNQIERASLRSAEITNHLLAFAGLGKYKFKELNLSEMIDGIRYLFETISLRRARIDYNLEPELPWIRGDESQLQRLLFEVINNAVDSFGAGKGVISVTTGVTHITPESRIAFNIQENLPNGNYVFTQISDNGSGIDDLTLMKVFEPFFTTKSAGIGLGLSAALGIARTHRGGIGIHTAVGQGTTVEIFLPVSATTSKRIDIPKTESGTDGKISNHPRVLIAEDEDDIRQVLQDYLTETGCEVTATDDGDKCCEAFIEAGGRFDCVILDMAMPRMSGEETLKVIRNLRPEIPVLVSSGYLHNSAINRIRDERVSFLPKPYQLESLKEAVMECLRLAAN